MTLPYQVALASPCKLNLSLDIGPRRDDGFHEIDSLVVRLSPADELTVTLRSGPRTVKLLVKDRRPDRVATETLPRGAENLAFRAAQLALDTFAPEQEIQVWITLVKRLPLQAGLGAGSSNAATVLTALGSAFGIAPPALVPLAATLGSDVTLFLQDAPVVRLQGRGDRVEAAPLELPALHGILVRPAEGVPTGPAYALLDALPKRVPGTATAELLAGRPLAEALGNDFEAAVLPAYPTIAALHRALLEAGAQRALLCGSGSTVFGLAQDAAHARELIKALVPQAAWIKQVTGP